MRINLFLSDVEGKNLEELLLKYGGRAPAYLRMLIARSYEKEFGGYKAKKTGARVGRPKAKAEEITDEQFCESVGGKVAKDSGGGFVCLIEYKGRLASIPLTDRKSILFRAKQMGVVKS